jgi:uncharacterized protein (DUF58 family)
MFIRHFWFPACLVALLIGLATSSGPLLGIAAFVLLAVGLARLWSRAALGGLRYERRIPEDRAFVGEAFEVTLRLVNDKPVPLPWVEVRDLFPEALPMEDETLAPSNAPGQLMLKRSTHMGWYERVSWPLRIPAPQRGYYRLGPSHLETGDLFGFFPVERYHEDYGGLIIYPRTYSLPELGLPADRPFGERRGAEPIFEDPGRIAGLREYRPGDSIRRIDWKATARTRQMQSRVYEPSSTLHLLVALNVDTLPRGWEGFIPEKLEHLVSAAGSVARWGIEAGYAVGLAANGAYPTADRPMRIPVGRSPDQLMKVLEALAVIGPLTMTTFAGVLREESRRFPFGATLVCVTAVMDEEVAAALRRIAGAGHRVSVLSLAERPFAEELPGIPIREIGDVMRSLEARALKPAVTA